MSEAIVQQNADGHFFHWHPSTLVELGLLEKDLEKAIVAKPVPLLLTPLGILAHDWACFDQVHLPKATGGRLIPDVLLLTSTGEIVVAEVKRLGNQELRGRGILSQVVDYAATLSSLQESALIESLTKRTDSTWEEVVKRSFPTCSAPAKLAAQFRKRANDAEVTLALVCDKAPSELRTWVEAAGRQSALAFSLHAIEIRPFVRQPFDKQVCWQPTRVVSTEIVQRTVVTFNNMPDSVSVEVMTEATSEEQPSINESLRSKGRRKNMRRKEAEGVLIPLAEELRLSIDELWIEMETYHGELLKADWSSVNRSLGKPGHCNPYLRGKKLKDGFLEGRFGVNLIRTWTPSIFLGAYLLEYDHKQPLLAPETGGDFALILDVHLHEFDGESFSESPLFSDLRERLQEDSGSWDFADHHAMKRKNPWHPLFLRKPLKTILTGTTSRIERAGRWSEAANDALRVLLQGGELAALIKEGGFDR